MSGFERSTHLWAKIAVIMSGLAADFVCLQWWEMHQGGKDTHDLSSAAAAQSEQTRQLAAQTKILADQAIAQAGHLKDLAERTKEVADQALIQAKATSVSANAAKSSAEMAIASTRPWMKVTSVDLRPGSSDTKTLMFHWPESGLRMFPQFQGKELPPTLQVKVALLNVGHSPAQNVALWSELFFHKFSASQWHADITNEEVRYCKSVARRKPFSAAQIAFPSERLGVQMGLSGQIKDDDVTRENGIRYSSAAMILCVNYNGVQDAPFQTQAWFGLYEDNAIALPVGVDTDAGHLQVIREASGDHAQ